MQCLNIPAWLGVSGAGDLAYVAGKNRSGATININHLVWVDREGNESRIDAPSAHHQDPRLSPDGRRLAIVIVNEDLESSNIWIYDLERHTRTRFTFHPGLTTRPVWSPEGDFIAYARVANGNFELYIKRSDGTGEPELLSFNKPYDNGVPYDWTSDGRHLVVGQRIDPTAPTSPGHLVLFPVASDGDGAVLLETASRRGRISPNGKWIAYCSDLSGMDEVFVQSFPDMTGQWQISTDGGIDPIWAPDGSELFYRKGGAIVSVPVETDSTFRHGNAEVLFQGEYGGLDGNTAPGHDLSPDGERFLMLKTGSGAPDETHEGATEIVLVENWFEELKRLSPLPEANQ